MAIHPGRHHLGNDRGRIVLTTRRDGLAAQAGHDLTIEPTRWSGELVMGESLAPESLRVQIDLSSLVVRSGSGGVKPLTERDKREIAVTAAKVLGTGRQSEAIFTASEFQPAAAGGGVIAGTLSLAGRQRPLRLRVTREGPGNYRAAGAVVQSAFGIKPYSAFLGSLKVRDTVDVAAEVSLPEMTLNLTEAPEPAEAGPARNADAQGGPGA